jgi:hypothetical protein
MFGRPLLIARIAVAELIDTLSENDFFNLIWVGTTTTSRPRALMVVISNEIVKYSRSIKSRYMHETTDLRIGRMVGVGENQMAGIQWKSYNQIPCQLQMSKNVLCLCFK